MTKGTTMNERRHPVNVFSSVDAAIAGTHRVGMDIARIEVGADGYAQLLRMRGQSIAPMLGEVRFAAGSYRGIELHARPDLEPGDYALVFKARP
jgi:hypothetical protein